MNKNLEQVFKYCRDIKNKKIISNKWVKKSVEKFLTEYKKQEDEDFPYFFDEGAFDKAVSFAELLYIPDLEKTLELLPYMKFIYANIWGWKYKSDPNKRRIRMAYIEIARKNSKTTSFLFPFILYDFATTPAAESYFISSTDKLAEKSFDELKQIIKNTKGMENIDCYSSAITFGSKRISFYGAESLNYDSVKPSLAVIDEYWCYPNNKPVTGMKYGMRARQNGLVCIITSAGTNISGPCYAQRQLTENILKGVTEQDDFFGVIYSYDDKDDWKNPDLLEKSNPGLGVITNKEAIISDLNEALVNPLSQADYRAKTCGFWSSATTDWISLDKIQQNKDLKYPDEEILRKTPCYGGLDLSLDGDLTAFSLCWFINNRYWFKQFAFIPEETLDEKYRRSNVNFPVWVQSGVVITTQGSTLDYDYIKNFIIEKAKQYPLVEIAFDRARADLMTLLLSKELPNLILTNYPQTVMYFTEPTNFYRNTMVSGEIVDNSPLTLWELGNAVVNPDNNGNVKPMKKNKASPDKIDNVITSIMALDRCRNGRNNNNPHRAEKFEDIMGLLKF